MIVDKPRSMTFEYPAPWVFVGKIVGPFTVDMVQAYVDAAAKALGHRHKAHIFHEFSEMDIHEAETRRQTTAWAQTHRSEIERHYVLVRSSIVKMGVATASMLVGGDYIVALTSPARFAAAIAAAKVAKPEGAK